MAESRKDRPSTITILISVFLGAAMLLWLGAELGNSIPGLG